MNKQLIELLHLLTCKEQHLYDMMKIRDRHDGICYFYLEARIESDNKPDYDKWEKLVENFKNSLNLGSDEEALEFIKQCITVSKDLGMLVENNENRLMFIHQLLI